MVTDKLTSTKIILLFRQFFAIFLYICTLAGGAMKSDFYLHNSFCPDCQIFIAAWYVLPWLQKNKKWLLVCYFLYLAGYAHVRSYAWKDSDTVKRGYWELLSNEQEEESEIQTTEEEAEDEK